MAEVLIGCENREMYINSEADGPIEYIVDMQMLLKVYANPLPFAGGHRLSMYPIGIFYSSTDKFF